MLMMSVFMVVSSWLWPLQGHLVKYLINADLVPAAASIQTKPADGLLPSFSTITIYYYYSAQMLILILPSTGVTQLNRPSHWSKGHHSLCKILYMTVAVMISTTAPMPFDSGIPHTLALWHFITDSYYWSIPELVVIISVSLCRFQPIVQLTVSDDSLNGSCCYRPKAVHMGLLHWIWSGLPAFLEIMAMNL